MHTVTIDLDPPCGPQAHAQLGRDAAAALRGVLGAGADGLAVVIRDAAPNPAQVVRAYLDAMERRDLDAARALLAPGFAMTFPGGVRMTTLEELIAWARPRYRHVAKTYQRFDALGGVVYCFGTLHGAWPDGAAFSGIRFIDRFELSGGRIVRQDVWNDMGEVRR